ncbi:hypothetical protein MPF19_15215 [Polaribacter sp. Z014]|uniref:helix-turn-helix transcriptional regulator n=1 Tax=Polaribacter sp. Z014 TaxID=2927126 RepID=UPI0020200FC0|nr:hypothetical protein [Polaribacter sp. Z014]MCL7764772.1 hypothetical protein [Polaribacter sp. Z014]
MISNRIKFYIKLFFVFFIGYSYAQKSENFYQKYIDSAANRIDNYPRISEKFLDSIPEPLEKSIKGSIASYYHFKAVLSSHLSRQAEVYHYNILSLKYAEKEKNYELAGAASIELFYNLYIVKKDTTALNYLKKAEEFYTINKDKFGLMDVMQMKAYIELYNKNYKKSNDLILPKLEYYKSIKDDSFYYLYALFMTTLNFNSLEDDINRDKYYKVFKTLEKDTTISPLLFNIHDVTLKLSLAETFLKRKKVDSALFYLKKADEMHSFMNNYDRENYYKYYATYYKELKDLKNENVYIDSLKYLHGYLIKENIDASFSINESFLKNSEILKAETKQNNLKRDWIIFLIVILIIIVAFVFTRYKSIKRVLRNFTKQLDDYSFLHNNHEKLKLKVVGLENYIVELKKEIKSISTITNIDDQRTKIKELHKEIHHSSSVLLVKGEDHLDLINNLNVEFFNQLSAKHPVLNSSEIIICYYLFMGFKSKEIGAFINNSVRSVESKRYRITNKLEIKEKGYKLVDYLNETFKDTATSF